jgi:hypothetical protein
VTDDPHSHLPLLPFDETRIKSPWITRQRGRWLRGPAVAVIEDELGDFLRLTSNSIPLGNLFGPDRSRSGKRVPRRALQQWWGSLVAGHPAYAPGRDPGPYVGAEVCEPREPAYSRYAPAIVLLGVSRYLPPPARVMFNTGEIVIDSLSGSGGCCR